PPTTRTATSSAIGRRQALRRGRRFRDRGKMGASGEAKSRAGLCAGSAGPATGATGVAIATAGAVGATGAAGGRARGGTWGGRGGRRGGGRRRGGGCPGWPGLCLGSRSGTAPCRGRVPSWRRGPSRPGRRLRAEVKAGPTTRAFQGRRSLDRIRGEDVRTRRVRAGKASRHGGGPRLGVRDASS